MSNFFTEATASVASDVSYGPDICGLKIDLAADPPPRTYASGILTPAASA